MADVLRYAVSDPLWRRPTCDRRSFMLVGICCILFATTAKQANGRSVQSIKVLCEKNAGHLLSSFNPDSLQLSWAPPAMSESL